MEKKTILSGSTVTGNLTLGNYIGAISNWASLQNEYETYYMCADLHALTVKQDPMQLRERVISFYAQYLACGLDPQKNTIFVQSHVPEHAQLAWILNCYTPLGHLNRMTQFKDKSSKTKNINCGLYTYPVLMAADILLYDAHVVPVGEDQRQHLELARDIVDIFHYNYGETFVMPEPYIGKVGAKIMSLQEPDKKMSKSDENEKSYISIIDPPKMIEKKIKGSVTDSGSEIKYDDNRPGISNLLSIYSALTKKSIVDIEKEYEGKMYGHLKVDLAGIVCEKLIPVQNKYNDLMNNKDYLLELMSKHAQKASNKANVVLKRVYQKIGLITF